MMHPLHLHFSFPLLFNGYHHPLSGSATSLGGNIAQFLVVLITHFRRIPPDIIFASALPAINGLGKIASVVCLCSADSASHRVLTGSLAYVLWSGWFGPVSDNPLCSTFRGSVDMFLVD